MYGLGDVIRDAREDVSAWREIAERAVDGLAAVRDLLPHGPNREVVTEEVAHLREKIHEIQD